MRLYATCNALILHEARFFYNKQVQLCIKIGITIFKMFIWGGISKDILSVLQQEHSAILSTFIKLLFVIKIFVCQALHITNKDRCQNKQHFFVCCSKTLWFLELLTSPLLIWKKNQLTFSFTVHMYQPSTLRKIQ